MAQKNIILEFENISYAYPGYPPVLEGFSAALQDGEIVCMIGASGCGKTTLLNIAGGFILPDSGRVIDCGLDVSRPELKRIMVFQDSSQLFPWLTVKDNIIFPLKKHKHKRQLFCGGGASDSDYNEDECALRLLKLVGLEAAGSLYPSQLSGGMKQRAVIARALSVQPEMLLLDEPFTALDAPTRKSLQELLIDLNKKLEISMLFVTHDITEAIYMSDRLIIMKDRRSRIIDIDIEQSEGRRDVYSSDFVNLERRVYEILRDGRPPAGS